MVSTEIFGCIEKQTIKVELKEEGVVEIGIKDIFNSSDEENFPNLTNQKPLDILAKPQIKFEKCNNIVTNINELDNKQIKEETNQEALKNEDKSEGYEEFNAGNNLQSGETLIINFTTDIGNIQKTRRNCNKGIHWADICKTIETTDCQEDMKKIIVTKAPLAATIVEPHEFTKLDKNNHVCNHCQLRIKNMDDLKRHIRRIHRDITTMYQCPYCSFKSKWDLKQHIILRHKNEEDIKWFKCDVCNVKLKTKSKMTRHIYTHLSSAQLGDLMKPCSVCQKKFKTSGALNRHVKFVHNKEPKKRLQCEKCDYSVVGANSMRKHIEICHTSPEQRRTLECEKCDYKTKYKYLFKAHSKKHENQYCCEKCAFVGTSITLFKLHQLTHETEIEERDLKYRCDKCDYKTYRLYSFNVHKLNHLKPDEIHYFYCYHCDFKAKRKDNLKTHVLKHFKKEEVTLQCFVCDFSTKKRHLLINHVNKHAETQNRSLDFDQHC